MVVENEREANLETIDLLTRIASLYYLEDHTQDEVAQEVGLSRQKVQRLLRQAREQGIVEINVHTLPLVPLELEKKIKDHFNLQDAVVAAWHPDEDRRRQFVARAAASYLERHLMPDAVVAIGMGRNTGEIANYFHGSGINSTLSDITFVSAMGGSPYVGKTINPNDICQRLADQVGGKAELLLAPAYVESQRVRDMFLVQEVISRAYRLSKKADIALIGIGTPTDDCTMVKMGCLSLAEANRLREDGAVGDMLGDFFDENGNEIHSDLHQRLIGLTLADLRNIARVIVITSEDNKARAILGALRTGIPHVLITDAHNAAAVLKLSSTDNS